jgi:carbamoyl-phosphate synthase large subunit
MRSVLILGASSLQIPLIEFVKKRGFRTIVVSIPGHYPGFRIADKSIYCDIRDAEAILSQILGENIVAVLTDETDIAVPTVAEIAEKLGLCGNSPAIAKVYSNKFLMREACRRAGVPVPNYIHVSKDSEIEKLCRDVNFPAMMKPEDNQGSRGVFKVENVGDISNHIADSLSFSSSNQVIIEEFFQGKEYVVEGFVIDGQYVNWGVAERRYFDIAGLFIPSQTIFPAIIDDDIKIELIKAEERLHHYLNPSFGMIHSEYIVNSNNGEFVLVETALRGGGVYISSHLVPLYTGYDNYSLLLDCSLGKNHKVSDIKFDTKSKSSAYMCFYLPPGTIESVSGVDKIESSPQVTLACLDDIKVGKTIFPIENKTQRLGPIIISAENRKELEEVMKYVMDTLQIVVRTVTGEKEKSRWE